LIFPETVLPLDGSPVTCGNRIDLPRAQRRHQYADMGTDFKNKGTEGITEVPVRACLQGGKDDR